MLCNSVSDTVILRKSVFLSCFVRTSRRKENPSGVCGINKILLRVHSLVENDFPLTQINDN